MTATGHAIIGTIIAAKFGNPYLAVPLAIASHILADMTPHWDTATNAHKKGKQRVFYETLVDIAAGFLLSYILIVFLFPQTNLLYAFFIIIVSQSLDWLMAPYYFFNWKTPIFVWAYKFQKTFDNSMDSPWGIINQIAILLFIIFLAVIL